MCKVSKVCVLFSVCLTYIGITAAKYKRRFFRQGVAAGVVKNVDVLGFEDGLHIFGHESHGFALEQIGFIAVDCFDHVKLCNGLPRWNFIGHVNAALGVIAFQALVTGKLHLQGIEETFALL